MKWQSAYYWQKKLKINYISAVKIIETIKKNMVSKQQKKRNHSIFETIATARKTRGNKKQNRPKGRPVKSLKGKSELRL